MAEHCYVLDADKKKPAGVEPPAGERRKRFNMLPQIA